MFSDLLKCPICSSEFNDKKHLPKIVPCGHTFCVLCLEKLIENKSLVLCPLDFQIILEMASSAKSFTSNLLILQQIEEKKKMELSSYCPIHHKKQNLVCLMDKTLLCKICAEYGDHEWHTVQDLSEFSVEVDRKKTELKSLLQAIEEDDPEEICDLIKTDKSECMKMVREDFENLNKAMQIKEETILEELEQFFTEEKLKIFFNKKSSLLLLKNKMEKDLEKLSQIIIDQQLLEAFSNSTKTCVEDKDIPALKHSIQKFEGRIKSNLDGLEKEFEERISAFNFATLKTTTPEDDWDTIEKQQQQYECPNSNEDQEKITRKKIMQAGGSLIVLIETSHDILINPTNWSEDETLFTPISEYLEAYNKTHRLNCQFNKFPLKKEAINLLNSTFKDLIRCFSLYIDLEKGCRIEEPLNLTQLSPDFYKGIKKLKVSINKSNIAKTIDELVCSFDQMGNIFDISFSFVDTNLSEKILTQIAGSSIWKKKIHALSLTFARTCVSISAIESFLLELQKIFAHLYSFRLSIEESRLSSSFLQNLGSGLLGKAGKLKRLSLEFIHCTPQALNNFLGQMKNFVNNLESLELNFAQTPFFDFDLLTFTSEVLDYLDSLKVLRLDFNFTNLLNSMILQFFEKTKKLGNLTELYLGFRKTGIENSSLDEFATSTIPYLKQLRRLELDLQETKITNESFISLKHACEKNDVLKPTVKILVSAPPVPKESQNKRNKKTLKERLQEKKR